MKDIIKKLKDLRKTGQQIVSPDFVIMYNPFQDSFVMDVPGYKKRMSFQIKGFEEPFYWDCTGMYPFCVKIKNDDYEEAWAQIQEYINGATIDLLPCFKDNNVEYTWIESEDGEYAVPKNEITVITE